MITRECLEPIIRQILQVLVSGRPERILDYDIEMRLSEADVLAKLEPIKGRITMPPEEVITQLEIELADDHGTMAFVTIPV